MMQFVDTSRAAPSTTDGAPSIPSSTSSPSRPNLELASVSPVRTIKSAVVEYSVRKVSRTPGTGTDAADLPTTAPFRKVGEVWSVRGIQVQEGQKLIFRVQYATEQVCETNLERKFEGKSCCFDALWIKCVDF